MELSPWTWDKFPPVTRLSFHICFFFTFSYRKNSSRILKQHTKKINLLLQFHHRGVLRRRSTVCDWKMYSLAFDPLSTDCFILHNLIHFLFGESEFFPFFNYPSCIMTHKQLYMAFPVLFFSLPKNCLNMFGRSNETSLQLAEKCM